MNFRSFRFFFALAALGGTCSPAVFGANAAVETGEIAGAKFAIARPTTKWNRRVLLLAPGYHPEGAPLVADLNPELLAHRTLLDEGWIIAATSFRRNGVIVRDAITDLDALRAHLRATDGVPDRVILEGDSMGGLIVTLIAERDPADPPLFSGAIAVGATLDLKEPNSAVGLNLQPRIPLLFLSNQSESDGPRHYAQPRTSLQESVVRPVLFRVARDGHVNVNQSERLAALRALNRWLDDGREALPAPPPRSPFVDVTVIPPARPSRATLHADRQGFTARISEVDAVYGNVVLEAQPADFEAVAIGKMARFQLTAHGKSFRVLLGRDFASVKRAEWIAFPAADGFTLLTQNSAHAATTASLSVGDLVTIRRYPSATEEKPDAAAQK